MPTRRLVTTRCSERRLNRGRSRRAILTFERQAPFLALQMDEPSAKGGDRGLGAVLNVHVSTTGCWVEARKLRVPGFESSFIPCTTPGRHGAVSFKGTRLGCHLRRNQTRVWIFRGY